MEPLIELLGALGIASILLFRTKKTNNVFPVNL